MSKHWKVSVVIVVHETYLPYLKNAVDHLRTNQPHELIIVGNGCSVDIDCTYNVCIPQTTLAAACNRGIEKAHGEYIVRLDADDFIDSSLIQTELEYLESHPDIDCVWCDYLEAEEIKKTSDFEVFLISQSPQEYLEHACGAMFRKSVWRDLGGYDESLEFQEAFDFWCRFFAEGYKASRLQIPMYFYRKGHNSMSTRPGRDKTRQRLIQKYGIQ